MAVASNILVSKVIVKQEVSVPSNVSVSVSIISLIVGERLRLTGSVKVPVLVNCKVNVLKLTVKLLVVVKIS